jgi:hypothetical protein
MKLRTMIILLALSLTFLAFANGITFSAWLSGRETITWHWGLPLATLAWTFIFFVLVAWNVKTDK